MIYDGLWSISESTKPELGFLLKSILIRIDVLFSKRCHPPSHWKWSTVCKASVASDHMTTHLCRWHITELTGICCRKRLRALSFPPTLSWNSYWRHLFLSFRILSLPLIFLENTRIINIELIRMELGFSASAQSISLLKPLISHMEEFSKN